MADKAITNNLSQVNILVKLLADCCDIWPMFPACRATPRPPDGHKGLKLYVTLNSQHAPPGPVGDRPIQIAREVDSREDPEDQKRIDRRSFQVARLNVERLSNSSRTGHYLLDLKPAITKSRLQDDSPTELLLQDGRIILKSIEH